jgi:anaerobic selenocysteine-containing dehydrogenase
VTLNTVTAARYSVSADDWVAIRTKRGSIRQRAVLSDDVDPRVVIGEHGWYFPEETQGLRAWDKANLNILTTNDPLYGRELGTATLRGMVRRIARADR